MNAADRNDRRERIDRSEQLDRVDRIEQIDRIDRNGQIDRIEPIDRIERFSRGERFVVEPERIERELSALWQEAGRKGDGSRTVTRACRWNIIAHLEHRSGLEGHEQAAVLAHALGELPRHVASRTLLLDTTERLVREEGTEEGDVESFISAKCFLGGGGTKMVCSEEISLRATASGARHIPALVRALLVPSVPTCLVVSGAPPETDDWRAALVRTVDRVLTHLDHSKAERAFSRAISLAQTLPRGLSDLGWIADAPMRKAIALFFDDPNAARSLRDLREVRVSTPKSRSSSARLLIAWIARCLGGLPLHPIQSVAERRWIGADGRHEFALNLDEAEETRSAVEFVTTSGRCFGRISRTNDGVIAERPHEDAGSNDGLLDLMLESKDALIKHLARGLSTERDDEFLLEALLATETIR